MVCWNVGLLSSQKSKSKSKFKGLCLKKNQKGPQPPTHHPPHTSKFNCKGVFSLEIEHWFVKQHNSLAFNNEVIKNCQAKGSSPKTQLPTFVTSFKRSMIQSGLC